MTTMTLSQARSSLSRVLDLVEDGEQVTITRHGAPAAAVVNPAVVSNGKTSQLDALTSAILERLAAARNQPIVTDARTNAAPEDIEQWVADMRAARDAR